MNGGILITKSDTIILMYMKEVDNRDFTYQIKDS